MKKIQIILAGLLAVSLLTCSASALSFPDVDSNAGYAAAVENISEYGIMVGDNQGRFNPDQIVSRAEMATIICRMLGVTENLSKSAVFTDVPATHWANAPIGKAAELGVVNGYGGGKFGPGDPVTYEQAVTMIVRAIGEDSSAVRCGGYPNGYLQVAEEFFLLEGIPAVQGQGLTRGSVAILLNNYYTGNPAKPGEEHEHHYVDRTMPGSGTGGHYEEVQVQIGTKTVNDYATVTTYGCNACSFTTTDPLEMDRHNGSQYETNSCTGASWWSTTKNVVVGTHEEPNYETRTTWVAGSEITVHVCALCGQMET